MPKAQLKLMRISDRLIEMEMPRLCWSIILIFLNLSEGKEFLFSSMSTLKRLLNVKNDGEIQRSLQILYERQLVILQKKEKRSRRIKYTWKVNQDLRSKPFFCIQAHHVAQVVGRNKQPGRLMKLSKNECLLWLWMQRKFSRIQIGGHDFRDRVTGWGFLEFKVKEAEGDLGFRILIRLLDKLQEKGLIQILSNPVEGKRSVLLFEPHFKPSNDPDQEKMKRIRSESDDEIPAQSYPESIASVHPVHPKQLNSSHRNKTKNCLESDPGFEKEILEQIERMGLSPKEKAGFRKLLRKHGPYLVELAIKGVAKSEQETTASSVKEMIEILQRERWFEFEEKETVFDDDGTPLFDNEMEVYMDYLNETDISKIPFGNDVDPDGDYDDRGRKLETIW
ncbi:MAG: hypothetical protein JXR49_12365 [Acidobacteria bacterium]|nr:hypothetical protein [Acidobacteriota bacterium]